MRKQLQRRNCSRAQATIRWCTSGRRGEEAHPHRGGPGLLGPPGREERPSAQNPEGGEAGEGEDQRDVHQRERLKAKHGDELVAYQKEEQVEREPRRKDPRRRGDRQHPGRRTPTLPAAFMIHGKGMSGGLSTPVPCKDRQCQGVPTQFLMTHSEGWFL